MEARTTTRAGTTTGGGRGAGTLAPMPAGLKTCTLVLLAVLLVATAAVLLTPVVHALLVDLGWLGEDKFLKVLRRLLLIPLVLVLFAWLRPWRDGTLASYGLVGPRARPRVFLVAWGLTAAVASTVLAVHFAAGWLAWEEPLRLGPAFGRVGRWVVVGLVLAGIEEWFFRGWLDRRFRRTVSPLGAACAVAGIYAAIHAFKPSRLDIEVTHDVAGAWAGLRWWLSNLLDPVRFGPTFVGLFLLSLLLTIAWRRTKTLWAPIGIHAAGITVLRSYGAFTERAPQRTWAGTKELFDGPPLWALLVAAIILLRAWPRPERRVEDAGSSS